MIIDGERLIISLDMRLDEVDALHEFIRSRIQYIDEIINEDQAIKLGSLALLQLLISIKKSRPEIVIPFLDEKKYVDAELGIFHWDDLWT